MWCAWRSYLVLLAAAPVCAGGQAYQPAMVDAKGQLYIKLYPYPDAGQAWRGPIAGAVVVYRGGRVIRTFRVDSTFFGWRFLEGGRWVEYSVGFMHGDARACMLYEVDSGNLLAPWMRDSHSDPPAWAGLFRSSHESSAIPT